MDDFSGLEYDQDSVSDEDAICKINNLLCQFNLPTQVTSMHDITAALFVILYESLFSDRLPGIIRQPVTREDEIHNCQTVIDVLSVDIIKDNLSHIRGMDIVDGKVQAVSNLIDIFTFLFEYVVKQIESDVPSETEDGKLNSTQLKQDAEAFERRPKDQRTQLETKAAWKDPENKAEVPNRQFDFIGLRPVLNQTSVEVTDNTVLTLSSKGSAVASTADSSNAVWRSTTPVTSSVVPHAVGSAVEAVMPGQRMVHSSFSENAPNLSTTFSLREKMRPMSAHRQDKLRATVGPVYYRGRVAPETQYQNSTEQMKGLSASYGDLYHMVQRTAAMSRAALDSNPMRMRRSRSSVPETTDFSEERYQVPPSEAMKLAKDLNVDNYKKVDVDHLADGDGHVSSSMIQKNAVFSTEKPALSFERSFRNLENISREKMSPANCRVSSRGYYSKFAKNLLHSPFKTMYGWETRGYSLENLTSRQFQPLSEHPETLKSNGANWSDSEAQDKLKERYAEVVEDVLSTGSDTDHIAAARRHHEEGRDQQTKLSEKLLEMGKPCLAEAQRHVERENMAFRRKQDILKKIYREEYEDVAEDARNRVENENKILKDMDQEYRKLVKAAAAVTSKHATKKPRNTAKPKGYLLPAMRKVRRSHPTVSTKVHNPGSNTGHVHDILQRPCDDYDLLPILLEEFPHLYMSEHTWHELWRRGIAQIENLTRAYEESKRKKSKAQQQVEEAARKHDVLTNIVKKQMDHSKRMHDIHDQKKQQVMLKNKLHEKRVHSARARRYYNEYQVRAHSKMLKRRTREEMIFKNLFKDGLAIQKERIQDLRRYAKEQREMQAQKRQDDIDSLENFYRDQFQMLVDRIAKDREDMFIRERAQQKVLDKMKKDLRHKMEKEIVDIQSQLFRDEDDAYFRQLDADRLRHELQLAKYQTKV